VPEYCSKWYTEDMLERFIVISLALTGLAGCTNSSQRPSPRASAVDLDGRPFDLWAGKKDALATVLIFTRTDCPISNRSAPAVGALCDRFQPLGVDFFLVYVDPRQDGDRIRRHLKEYHYTCPAIRDPYHSLAAECKATVTPEAVVFDAQRAVVYQGRIDDLYADFGEPRTSATTHELADALEAIVNGEPVAQPRTKAIGCYISDLK
jgi:hypothetical protein